MKLAIILLALTCASCASIVDNGPDLVAMNSIPDGATVLVDGVKMGKTPVVVPVSREWGAGDLVFKIDGRPDIETSIGRDVNPWVFGNIIFGGLIGVGVDCATGNCRRADKFVRVDFERGIIRRQARRNRMSWEKVEGYPVTSPSPKESTTTQ